MNKAFADAFDRFATSTALFLFLWSISLAMEASAYLIDERIGQYLTDWARVPYGLGFLALLVAVIIYSRRRGPITRGNIARSPPHSYVTDTINRSARMAFVVTLLLVAVLDYRADYSELPAGFFIKLPGFALLATYSVSYFFLNRSSTEDDSHEQEPPP
jgi:hypothetical protein